MRKINIQNETSQLKVVVLGIANNFGGTPKAEDCYDPKSKEHVIAGTYPKEEDCIKEMNAFLKVLERYQVKVYRPENILGLNQIFSRDIAFVIDNKLLISNTIKAREKEINAMDEVLNLISYEEKIEMPETVRAEGGDIILCNEYIFVGYSEKEDFEKFIVSRTNKEGVKFLEQLFPNKKVKAFELNKSDDYPRENTLHLDCCFQPIGRNMAILYKGGFKNSTDVNFIVNYFGEDNIIDISKEEMYTMHANVFSVSENIIVSEKGFARLNNELRKRGFTVEEIPYSEVAKMEGLLRCSTMPLIRE